jgi:uncharacterized protein (TIGR02147 family)
VQRPHSLVPEIYRYTDHRVYLQDYYAFRKGHDRNFSHRHIHQKVGASSSGWFSDVVKGRITLTSSFRVKLARLLELKPREEDYFEAIVNLTQAATDEEKDRCFRKLLSFKEVKTDLVGREKFEYYSRWYHGAIRELLYFYDFQGDYAALARKLTPAIKPSEARKAIRLLESLQFISRDAQGRYVLASGTLKKDPAFKAANLARLFKANMELAMSSFETQPKEIRDISALTLSFSPQGYQKATEEIRALRKRLLALMQEDLQPDKVYQCNFHLFPVTK